MVTPTSQQLPRKQPCHPRGQGSATSTDAPWKAPCPGWVPGPKQWAQAGSGSRCSISPSRRAALPRARWGVGAPGCSTVLLSVCPHRGRGGNRNCWPLPARVGGRGWGWVEGSAAAAAKRGQATPGLWLGSGLVQPLVRPSPPSGSAGDMEADGRFPRPSRPSQLPTAGGTPDPGAPWCRAVQRNQFLLSLLKCSYLWGAVRQRQAAHSRAAPCGVGVAPWLVRRRQGCFHDSFRTHPGAQGRLWSWSLFSSHPGEKPVGVSSPSKSYTYSWSPRVPQGPVGSG